MRTKYVKSFSFIYKALLGYLAYFSILPYWLAPLLNKLRGVKIKNPFRVYIAPSVLIDSLFPEQVTIEDEVYLTRGVKILCHTNYTRPIEEIAQLENKVGPVHISYGAFIGVDSIILPNVRIGRCAIVGSGSVVTRDVPDYAIVGGNPAKIIGDVRELKKKESKPS